jgi:hypothetical protein
MRKILKFIVTKETYMKSIIKLSLLMGASVFFAAYAIEDSGEWKIVISKKEEKAIKAKEKQEAVKKARQAARATQRAKNLKTSCNWY